MRYLAAFALEARHDRAERAIDLARDEENTVKVIGHRLRQERLHARHMLTDLHEFFSDPPPELARLKKRRIHRLELDLAQAAHRQRYRGRTRHPAPSWRLAGSVAPALRFAGSVRRA